MSARKLTKEDVIEILSRHNDSEEELILWNKDTGQSMHQPEMCNLLGIRKKMPSRKEANKRIMNQRSLDEHRLTAKIEGYTFPVEVRKIG